jgi:hypothetical protein
MRALVFKNMAYVPIWKNATSTFTELFEQMFDTKWIHVDKLDNSYKLFGHIRHPIERHFRGVAQYIQGNNLTHLLDNENWQQICSTGIFDSHSYPITSMLGSHVKRVKWIPIASGIDTNELTKKYLNSNNIEINDIKILNKSREHSIYNRLKEINLKFDPTKILSLSFEGDFELWNSIFPYVDEDNMIYHPTLG